MIGVYDSGLGGLLSLNQIYKDYPLETIIYFGDSTNAPYGNKDKKDIKNLIDQNIKMLKDIGVDDLVLACNTICSIVDFNHDYGLKLHDIITKTVAQLNIDPNKKVFVFATKASIESGRYQKELYKLGYTNSEYFYLEKLASYIEEFKSHDEIKEYLYSEFKKIENKPDAIILGCTHFPVVEDIFKEYFTVPIYNSRNLHFNISEKNEGSKILVKMKKSDALERFLGTYVNVPYEYYV